MHTHTHTHLVIKQDRGPFGRSQLPIASFDDKKDAERYSRVKNSEYNAADYFVLSVPHNPAALVPARREPVAS